jgi:hypothetical protein
MSPAAYLAVGFLRGKPRPLPTHVSVSDPDVISLAEYAEAGSRQTHTYH